jgi:transcriptional regulator with XRE-family HTH domain
VERPGLLRLRRLALGLSLHHAAHALKVDASALSLVERGLRESPGLIAKLDAFLTQQEKLTRPVALPVKQAASER